MDIDYSDKQIDSYYESMENLLSPSTPSGQMISEMDIEQLINTVDVELPDQK